MSRYIDADELKRNHMFYHEADNRSYAEERDIDETPTVDAVPVVHGEWIRTDDNICHAHICSVCRKHVRVCIGLRCHDCDTEANYCPNCGAKMDGETEYVSTYSLGKISVPKGAIKQIIADGERKGGAV